MDKKTQEGKTIKPKRLKKLGLNLRKIGLFEKGESEKGKAKRTECRVIKVRKKSDPVRRQPYLDRNGKKDLWRTKEKRGRLP